MCIGAPRQLVVIATVVGGCWHSAEALALTSQQANQQPPEPPPLVRGTRADDAIWQEGATEGAWRSQAFSLKATVALDHAQRAASAAVVAGRQVPGIFGLVAPAAAQAERSRQEAVAWEKQAEILSKSLEQKAYTNARASADRELKQLEQQGANYFATLVSQLRQQTGVSSFHSEAQAQVIAQVDDPYLQVKGQLEKVIFEYNQEALSLASQVQSMGAAAKGMAAQAQIEQAKGSTLMAAQRMAQARNYLAVASIKRERAEKIRELVEKLNTFTPLYAQAAQMAVEHTMAKYPPSR